ncbi:hypothetical protein BDZ91DRAFT_97377 [Kalaharituber pfeilii]|nr:hypothetical protein BDZ91DRAFT_97377 [Kalaharituber pfeilii]
MEASHVTRVENMKGGIKPNFANIIGAMARRFASHPLDKLSGLMFLYDGLREDGLPIYDRSLPIEEIWAGQVQRTAAHQADSVTEARAKEYALDLLYSFPHPSGKHWIPSWRQVMAFPDLSVREEECSDEEVICAGRPVLPVGCGVNCRLELLKQEPGSNGEITWYMLYFSTKDGKHDSMQRAVVLEAPLSEFPQGIPEGMYIAMPRIWKYRRIVLGRALMTKCNDKQKNMIYARKVAAVNIRKDHRWIVDDLTKELERTEMCFY